MTHQHETKKEKNESPWRGVVKDIIFDKAVWLFAALCLLGYSYWQKVKNTSTYLSPMEFSISQMKLDVYRDYGIRKILLDLIHEVNGDRAYIMLFHNGDKLAGGISFKKMSCAYEVSQIGVSREVSNLQNIPLSTVPECLKQLVDNENAFPIKVDELPCGTSRALLESQGIKTTIRKRITIDNSILGFLAVNYVRSDFLSGSNYESNIQYTLNKINNAEGYLQLELEK